MRPLVPGILITAFLALPGTAHGSACAEASEGPTVVLAPAAWREAVAALRAATADGAQPWGCAGGTIDIVEHDGVATLIVASSGGSVSREVESPDDVVPLGEALLAKPIAPPSPPAPLGTTPKPLVANPEAPTPAAPPRDPRVVVSATLAPRYAGRSNLMLGGVGAAVGLPVSNWVPALWVRFDGTMASFGQDDASLMEFCAGAAFGRSFGVGIVDLRPSLTGSAAVVIRPDRPHISGDTHVDPRFGAELRVAFPRASLVRAVLSTDAELAPLDIATDDNRTMPTHPLPVDDPSYTLGLGFGVEIAPR